MSTLYALNCMVTSSNGNIFRVTGHLCGEFTVPRWIPTQRPVAQSFDVFFDLHLNKRLSKQSWGWWLETLSRPLWRHRYGFEKNLPFCGNEIYLRRNSCCVIAYCSFVPKTISFELLVYDFIRNFQFLLSKLNVANNESMLITLYVLFYSERT